MQNIQGFRDTFRGSRSNRYKITGQKSAGEVGTTNLIDPFTLYAKSTSFPGSQIGMIPVSYQGRVIKFTGERQFAEWSIQVYDSATTALTPVKGIHKIFEDWISRGDDPKTHVQRYNNASPSPWEVRFDDIKTDTTGSVAGGDALPAHFNKVLYLFNCWPIDISPIDLSYEAADSFAEFTLTFAYDFHKMNSIITT